LVGFATTNFTPGAGADIVMESITLKCRSNELPVFVRVYRIGETSSHEEITPVGVGKFYRLPEFIHSSTAQLQRGKPNTL
jgi:hypothetical protein